MKTATGTSKNGTLKAVTPQHFSSWIDDIFPTTNLVSHFNTALSVPKVNVRETKDDFIIDLAVPGFDKSDFKIDIDKKVLSVAVEAKNETTDSGENYTRKEFAYSAFKKTFTLPDSVDESKIKANYINGILAVQLPKREEAKEQPARTITIE